jgi:iron-sulfur cluster assembly accessory protein
MVSLTPRAAGAIKSLQTAESAFGFGLRLQVVAGGCGGYLYDLTLVESGADGDARFESEGITLWIERRAVQVVEGLVIDFGQTPYGEGFLFQNPMSRGQCACGASFER